MGTVNNLTKATKMKLMKAATAIQDFSGTTLTKDKTDSPLLAILNVTDSYRLLNNKSDITFTLKFLNVGVGATTNAVLADALTDKEISIVKDERDSLINHAIKKDNIVNRKFLNLRTTITATELTTLPAALKVEFTIFGGIQDKTYEIPKASFKNKGESIIIDISIFFF